MQAALLYGILCAQSSDSILSQDIAWVVEMIEHFGRRLFGMTDWDRNTDLSCTSYSRWVLVESMRRIGSALYLFDLLLQSNAPTPSKGNCDTFWNMPLPCARQIWSSTSETEWRHYHQAELEYKTPTQQSGLTLGDLLLLRQTPRLDEMTKAGRPEMVVELAQWCEKADDLSMLLWMALTVHGEGQAPIAQQRQVS